jgi:hypothetical protein
VEAAATADGRRQRHPVPGREVLAPVDLDDLAGDLVAQDVGQRHGVVAVLERP